MQTGELSPDMMANRVARFDQLTPMQQQKPAPADRRGGKKDMDDIAYPPDIGTELADKYGAGVLGELAAIGIMFDSETT